MIGLFLAAVFHVAGVDVDVTPRRFAFASCRAAAAYDDETGHADVDVRYVWDPPRSQDGGYVGSLRARIRGARVRTAAFSWTPMSEPERTAASRSESALLTHELGHVATVAAALRAQHLPIVIRAATRAAYAALAERTGDRLFAQLERANDAYDVLTAHGLAQWNAPLPRYRTESTLLACPPNTATALER